MGLLVQTAAERDGTYIETGEIRKPLKGESWISLSGHIYSGDPGMVDQRRIVVRREEAVTSYAINLTTTESMDDVSIIEDNHANPLYET